MVLSALENTILATHPKDDSLLELWSGGWPQAPREFEALVDVFGERLARYAFRRIGNLHDAEDVAQKVFVQAFAVRKRYRDVQNVGPYLYRMTANACTDWLRYRGRRPETPLEETAEALPSDWPDAGDEAAAREEQQRIEGWLQSLPQRQADVIRLRVFGDLPFAEIAQSLGCSEPTVKSRFRYGLEKLKAMILGRKEAP